MYLLNIKVCYIVIMTKKNAMLELQLPRFKLKIR